MTEIIIDESTGLPELPEGEWWEVSRASDDYGGHLGYRVSIHTTGIEPEMRTPAWWGRRKTVIPAETKSYSLAGSLVRDEERFAEAVELSHNGKPYSHVKIFQETITPADVVRTAQRILLELRSAEAKAAAEIKVREASDALVGKYPPKTLAGGGAK